MIKKLSKLITIIFHPLLMPTLGVLIIFYAGSYISFLPNDIKKIILLVIGANTLGLPLLMMPLFVQFGVVKSLAMESHKERLMPLSFTLIPYFLSVYFLIRLPIPNIISAFMLGASLSVAFCLITTIWWKVSIHMVGIGGIVGFLIAFSIRLYVDVFIYLFTALIVAGLLASARLYLKAHKPLQIYVGFTAGLIIMLTTILLFK
ncbi:MAG: hypothetical protein AB9846_06710 [Tenuifilaceae bacterium]